MHSIRTRFTVGILLLTVAGLALPVIPSTRAGDHGREPGLPSPLCNSLQVPPGNEVAEHAFAVGSQVYRWNGAAWDFVAPVATLSPDAGHTAVVGIHYAGPTWDNNGGSKVVGRRVAACSPDPTAIPWLLLEAASTTGPGVFSSVTFIQRVNTAGGLAPATPGSSVGEVVAVPYSAEYFFYRADD